MCDPDLDEQGLFKDDGGKMTLITGTRVNPLKLTPADVSVVDIAHALSRQCRYNGHVEGFLSVARHSLWVAEHLEHHGPAIALAGLMHDAAEAYLGDMIRPLKRGPLGAQYREVEARIEAAIAEACRLPHPQPVAVTDADTYVLLNRELNDARWHWFSTPAQDFDEFMAAYDRYDGAR